MKKLFKKVSQVWWMMVLQYNMILQAVYTKKNWIKYITFDLNLFGESMLQKEIIQIVDELGKEANIPVFVYFITGEDNLKTKDAAVGKGLVMASVPKESSSTGFDMIVVHMKTLIDHWGYFDFGHTHNIHAVIRELIRHEMRHIEQYMEMRKRGMDVIEAISKDANILTISAFGYLRSSLEYDAYRTQFNQPSSLKETIDQIAAA